ncbi:hypothetical protein [Psychrobacter sp. CAL346-MNA-CIBAN-0220]|uniref:hypothetical protein n=1 Tax=Psychrobacter sp. CAL346-MNA-CIBAN-0220 TaxID=3140457 RepID=UPI003320EC29
MKHNEILFISPDSNLNFHNFFDGYAFFGVNLVIGRKGFEDFSKEHTTYNSYEDGNYILIDKISEDKYRLSRDYHGYYPLFYYDAGDYWCVSNSIIYIVEHLKDKGISVSYNESNVEIWKSELALALQLTSYNTFVNEIKVLPISRDIILVKDDNDNQIYITKREKSPEIKESYKTALKNCLEIWRSRYLTILSNKDIALHHDLSGGLDSRCLLSFMMNNAKVAKDAESNNRLKINSNPKHTKDFEIAKRLVSLFDFNLNTKIDKKYQLDKPSAQDSYAVWKYFNVGRYSPIVFPITDFKSKLMEIGGEGGGDNRNFYSGTSDSKYSTFSEYIEKYKQFFSSEDRYTEWVKQIDESSSVLKEDSEIDVSVLHYKEFRSTCHTIKSPRSRMKIAVLGSKYFDKLSQLSSKDEIKSGQSLYDVMYNNSNKLLYIPFDHPSKGMTDKNISYLPIIDTEDNIQRGEIYWSKNEERSDLLFELPIDLDVSSYSSPLQILRDKAFMSLEKNKELIEYYFGKSYINKFYQKFESIDFQNSIDNLQTPGSFMHSLILIEFMSDMN